MSADSNFCIEIELIKAQILNVSSRTTFRDPDLGIDLEGYEVKFVPHKYPIDKRPLPVGYIIESCTSYPATILQDFSWLPDAASDFVTYRSPRVLRWDMQIAKLLREGDDKCLFIIGACTPGLTLTAKLPADSRLLNVKS